MKKLYKKEFAALAIAGLLSTYSANAQVDVYTDDFGVGLVASGAGPLVVDGDAQVSGTLTVQPENVVSSSSTDSPTGAGIDPLLGSVNATDTTVVTKLGETFKEESATTGGGAVIENNGDTTLSATTGTESEATFARYTTVDVYNADQPLAGQPVPGSQTYYAADLLGNQISPTFATEAALDAWVTATPLSDASFTGLVTTTPTTASGGNLQVGGDANVDGVLSLGDTGSGAVADVAASIYDNSADIAGNAADIASNDADIASNESDIIDNAGDIATNAGDIATNAGDIATNAGDIATNAGDIATNAGDIATNAGDIATNAGDIATNASDIAQEVADRSALISDMGPNADGNQVVHIGDNSLITEELGGTQRLRAEDGSGDNIDIRFDGDAGVIVDNFLEVTAPDAGAQFSTDTSSTGSLNPETDTSTATTTPVVTRLGTTTGTEVDGGSGGVLLENNGNVTLSQGGGIETTVEVIQATTFDVYNADQPLAGQPVPGTQEYVAGYVNGSGDFVEISPTFATQALLQDWIVNTPLTDSAYDAVRSVESLEGSGGNLYVGGSAYIAGLQSSYNPDGDIEVEFGAVNSAVAANSSAIALNSSAIADNASAIKSNKDNIEANARGIAMVAALQTSTLLPGMDNALDVGIAHFEGETGMSLNYARRINDNVQINFGAASTTDFDEAVIKAGVGYQW